MFEMKAMLLPSGDHVGTAHLARHVELFNGQAARFDLGIRLGRDLLGIGDGLRRGQSLRGRQRQCS